MSQDSVVTTTVTCYKLDGLGTESRWWPHFLHLSRPVVGPIQPPTHRVSFPELKWLGHLPTSSDEAKEKVEQYLCSTSGSSWPGLR
jgi:hypothetical protein